MTTAGTTPSAPWYKHPWVWFIIIIPVVSVVLSFTMLYVAVVNKDSEVKDDWYKDKKAVTQDFHRDNTATLLELKAAVSFRDNGIVATLSSPGMLPDQATPDTLSLLLSHPTDVKKDIQITLNRASPGQYTGTLPAPVKGRYYVELGCQAWRLKETGFFPTDTVALKASPR